MALLICKVCHSKDEIWRDRSLDQAREIDGVMYLATVTGKACGHCGHERLPAQEKNRLERSLLRAIAENARPGKQGFTEMRKFLGYNKKSLAALLGIATRTVVRWESGGTPVKRTTWWVMTQLVLEELDGKDDLAARLRTLSKPGLPKIELTVRA